MAITMMNYKFITSSIMIRTTWLLLVNNPMVDDESGFVIDMLDHDS